MLCSFISISTRCKSKFLLKIRKFYLKTKIFTYQFRNRYSVNAQEAKKLNLDTTSCTKEVSVFKGKVTHAKEDLQNCTDGNIQKVQKVIARINAFKSVIKTINSLKKETNDCTANANEVLSCLKRVSIY